MIGGSSRVRRLEESTFIPMKKSAPGSTNLQQVERRPEPSGEHDENHGAFVIPPMVLGGAAGQLQIRWLQKEGEPIPTIQLESARSNQAETLSVQNAQLWLQQRGAADLDHRTCWAVLPELSASECYNYRLLGEVGQPLWHGSFVTPPSAEVTSEFSFAVVSDSHANDGLFAGVAEAVGRESTEFVLDLGDYKGGYGPDWDRWPSYFKAARPYLDKTALFPVAGDHDGKGSRNLRALLGFSFGEEDPLTEESNGSFYQFQYGNADFFVLDCTTDLEPQMVWLEEVLKKSQAVWKIVAIHFSQFNAGGRGLLFKHHFSRLAEIYEAHGVDLVLSGHDHVYERPLPVGSATSKPVQYLSLNSGGNFREVRPSPIISGGMGHQKLMYARFHISGSTLTMEAKTASGEVFDQFKLEKDDAGNPSKEVMDRMVDREVAVRLMHVFTGNLGCDLRYSRRDLNAEFVDYPKDEEPVGIRLQVSQFPAGSELIIHHEEDPWGWRTGWQKFLIGENCQSVVFEVITPRHYGAVGRHWTPWRGGSVALPPPEFTMRVRFEGCDFEPARVRPTFGVALARP